MIVAVGSTNPTKINPVRKVFSKHFKNVSVVAVAVESCVSEQPLSDEEMHKGALYRARQALKKAPKAQFGVGIEGGLNKYSYGWLEKSLVVILDRKGHEGIGTTAGVVMPQTIMQYIHKGKSIEETIDLLFGTKKIGEGIGMFGIFTKGLVTRSKGVEHGVAFAFTRFLHKKLY